MNGLHLLALVAPPLLWWTLRRLQAWARSTDEWAALRDEQQRIDGLTRIGGGRG